MAKQSSVQFFAGDADVCLTWLLEASHARPAANPALVERQLVPWSDDSCNSSSLLAPLEQNRRPLPSSAGKFPARHARSPTAAAAAAANKRSKVAASPTQIPRASSNGGRRLSAEHIPAGFACPAVAASPKPETLPMPTGLMSRAMAVRSRSPSPPKDSFFAVSVLAHVHPVAA